MRNPEDVRLGYRIALTIAIVVFLVIVLGVTGCLTGGWDTQ